MRHHPAGNTPGHAPGVTEVANDGLDDGALTAVFRASMLAANTFKYA
jgi:hypothetical protein